MPTVSVFLCIIHEMLSVFVCIFITSQGSSAPRASESFTFLAEEDCFGLPGDMS